MKNKELIKEQKKKIQSYFNEACKTFGFKKYKGYGYYLKDDLIVEMCYNYNYKNGGFSIQLRYAPLFLDEIFWKVYGIEEENKNVPYYKRFWDKESLRAERIDIILDRIDEDTDCLEMIKNNFEILLSRNEEKLKTAGYSYNFIRKKFEVMYETNYCPMFFEVLMCLIYSKHYKVASQLAKFQIRNEDIGPRIKSFKNGIEKGIYEYAVEYCENHMMEDIEMAVQDVNVIDAIGSNDEEIELLLIDTLTWDDIDDHWSLLKEKLDTYFHYIMSGQIINYKENFSDYRIKIKVSFMIDFPDAIEEKLLEIKSNLGRLHHIKFEWEIG